ncbi:hydroxysqualene dehydroxylase [Tenuibacillus multivorans]|uniref:15-cis-phytoene desaturase n=1 Tax=Tenuibacillus multivorans TaxID=237069 RepID=A0A1H0AM89_9BACI|nr:NAD(P)/FAD-dependent oxidoreductase [Tenuibacillus multivorans]GEL78184.1 phytoene desaturase [Tenuibacillus multivorans]SDN33946.1 15-cis-phytoene desaturase [Tenuibacillus multivorans]
MSQYDVLIIGSGLAGITCSVELSEKGYKTLLIEAEEHLGGRTSSWYDDGMHIDSGFHRVLGYYKHLPALLKKAGIDIDKVVKWEERIDVRSPLKDEVTTFGVAPFRGPIKVMNGIFGNPRTMPVKDMLSLGPFFANGLLDYMKRPDYLDRLSVYEYAKKHHVTDNAFHMVVIPFTSGIFFLPPERFSAYVFFGMLAPVASRFYKMRLGAYLDGMNEVMIEPLAKLIREQGVDLVTGTEVMRLIYENSEVKGVASREKDIRAKYTVLATGLGAAKRILKQSNMEHPFVNQLIKLPTMPAISVQIDLDEPALPYDRTTFGAGSVLSSFSEQSRTTFKKASGRLSITVSPPDQYIDLEPKDILEIVLKDAKKLGLELENHIRDYRVVFHPDNFYTLEPGYDWMRPEQDTPIKGLALAGDYTKHSHFPTMEGAVMSGKTAAKIIEGELNDSST